MPGRFELTDTGHRPPRRLSGRMWRREIQVRRSRPCRAVPRSGARASTTIAAICSLTCATLSRSVQSCSAKNGEAVAEQRLRERDLFLAVAEHKLKNPLMVLQGWRDGTGRVEPAGPQNRTSAPGRVEPSPGGRPHRRRGRRPSRPAGAAASGGERHRHHPSARSRTVSSQPHHVYPVTYIRCEERERVRELERYGRRGAPVGKPAGTRNLLLMTQGPARDVPTQAIKALPRPRPGDAGPRARPARACARRR